MSLVKSQISITQTVFLLLISKAFSVLNYIPIFTQNFSMVSLLIANIISFFIGIILLIPFVIFQKKYNNQPILIVAMQKNKILGYVIGIGFLLILMLNIMGTIVSFSFFMTNAIFPNSSSIFIVSTLALACFISSLHGLEGLARGGSIVFFIFMAGIIFMLCVATKSVDPINIRPILSDPVKDIYSAVSYIIARFTEFFALIILAPNIKGTLKKTGMIFLVTSTVFVEVVTFYIAGILGDYVYSQTFPYYTVASIIETNMLQRLDSVHMAIWVLVSFIRICLYMVVANACIKDMFPKVHRVVSYGSITLITAISSILLVNSPRLIKQLNTPRWVGIITFIFAIPLILSIKTKKERLANEENITIPTDSNGSAV